MLNVWRWGRWSLGALLVDYFTETPQIEYQVYCVEIITTVAIIPVNNLKNTTVTSV
jgi:hypothetical protein